MAISDYDFSQQPIDELKEELYEEIQQIQNQEKIVRPLPRIYEGLKGYDIYNNLPDILYKACEGFEKENKDIVLLGCITVLSAMSHNIHGTYFHRNVYPNLYFALIGESGMGKGNLYWANRLITGMQDRMDNDFEEAKNKYEIDLKKYNNESSTSQMQIDEQGNTPKKPIRKVLFEADTFTVPGLLKHLDENDSIYACVDEIDKIINNSRTAYGDISPILRLCFHHDRLAQYNKTDDQYLKTNEPKLSFTIAGTPRQAQTLFENNLENGLFSRFLVYNNNQKSDRFLNPFERSGNDYYQVFQDLAKECEKIPLMSECEFRFTKEQEDIFNSTFDAVAQEYYKLFEGTATGIRNRNALMLFKVAMLFTNLRRLENNDTSEIVYCSEEDFFTAYYLVIIVMRHVLRSFTEMDSTKDMLGKRRTTDLTKKASFYLELPNEFTRAQAKGIYPSEVNEGYISKLLKQLISEGKIKKLSDGEYKKI